MTARTLTMLKLLTACPLLLVTAANAPAGERPFPPRDAKARVTAADKELGPGEDPFAGEYVGTFHPLGAYDAKSEGGDNVFKPQKCGACHAQATIDRADRGYLFTMVVDHGKDKQGKPQKERITLKGEHRAGTLTLRNEHYSIAVAKGEAIGSRTGRMEAEVKLKRKTAAGHKPGAMVGAYYFDGWAGKSQRWQDDPAWTKLNPPTHLTKRMIEEFASREPIWGWRDDSLATMERQIDLAADHGIAFFAFCWYWNKDPQKLAQDPKHTGLSLFLEARNNHRLKFCLLVANHAGFLFQGADDWRKAAEGWLPYLKHPQYVTVDGKPLVIIFNPGNGDRKGFSQVQAVARKEGLPGVAIAGCGGGAAQVGFTHRTHYNIIPGYAAGSEAHKYAELVQAHQRAWHGSRDQPYMPALSVGWDKRPWEGDRGLGQKPGWYYPDRTPSQFAAALESAIQWMDQHPDQTTAERIVLLYAWNEFGEGGYLAPTKGDPEGAYLKALKQVVEGVRP